MNISTDQINQARKLIEQNQGILILLGKNPKLDSVAGVLSLYLALISKGKNIKVSCPTPMIVEFRDLVGVDKIGNNIGNLGNGKNLVISFPYQEGSIEKVSYNIENDTFNLVIEPREGYPQITPEMMRYSYSGENGDLIITVGLERLDDLNSIYQNNPSLFSEKDIINIDTNTRNQKFGKINLVDQSISCLSELMLSLFPMFGLSLDQDISNNLFAGIVDGTNNFSSEKTNAATFEAAAICLKNGARKTMSQQSISTNNRIPYTQPSTSPKMNFPQQPVSFQKPKPKVTPQMQRPTFTETTKPLETPPDWLKPKIYKGSTLL